MTENNTLYEQSIQDPIKAHYIQMFNLLPYDENLLWIIDELAVAYKSQSEQELSKTEIFYRKLLTKLLKNSKDYQYNSLFFVFTQKPPEAIRKVFIMCAYLNLEPIAESFWVAMLALCIPMPDQWSYDRTEGFYFTSNLDESARYAEYVPNASQKLPFHPCDPVLLSLKQHSTGSLIIPSLLPHEYAKVSANFLFIYDLRHMKPQIVPTNDSMNLDMLSFPDVDFDFLYKNDLRNAFLQANETVFEPRAGLKTVETEIDLEKYFKEVVGSQRNSKNQLNKKLAYQLQRQAGFETSLVKLQKKLKVQPEVSEKYIFELMGEPGDKILFYGYTFVDQKAYQIVKQQSINSPLNNLVAPQKQFGNKLQIRICVALFRNQQVQKYVRTTDLSVSQGLKQSKHDQQSEIIMCNIDGKDYPLQCGIDTYDFKIGMSLQVAQYSFNITQLSNEARYYLTNAAQKAKNCLNKIIEIGGEAAKEKYSKYLKQWEELTFSPREMAQRLVQIAAQVKDQVEFMDYNEVFK
ncbi:Conserved_hypothetical protein [Hexamita inflata]|uniref:Uncharacterized protein n=1 Tax=Hexamita inflata TaxID=28002 RepID=A0AA86TWU4_9EUKA|nr:Conserved hypothetical protein [Hexamita inflata]CAI9961975.1 Conserved hypothetical protein [Hexamita inflata]